MIYLEDLYPLCWLVSSESLIHSRFCDNLLPLLHFKATVIFPGDCSVFTSSLEPVTCCYPHTGFNLLIPGLCICLIYIALSMIYIVDTLSHTANLS